MKWKIQIHFIRKIQRAYRENWWVRAVTLVLVLAFAVLLNEFVRRRLAQIPWPVSVEAAPSTFAPARARFRQEELVIENPNLSSNQFLLYSGQRNELVDVHCTSARLTAESINLFKEEAEGGAESPPVEAGKIDFAWQPDARIAPLGVNEDTCKTTLTVELVPGSKPPTKIRFFQADRLSSDEERLLMMVVDAEMIVNLKTVPSYSSNPNASGCKKLIGVGGWKLIHEEGMLPLKFITSVGSKLRFIFKPLDERSPYWDKDEFINRLKFGDQPLRAQLVSISTSTDDQSSSSAISTASSVDNRSLLAISSLEVGSKELRLNVSGKGFVQTEGEYTSNFLEHASARYKILALLIGLIDTTFLGWWFLQLKRLIFPI